MPAPQIRRGPVVIAVLAMLALVFLVLLGGLGPHSSPTPKASDLPNVGGCQSWCGTGSATITLSGTTIAISGGGCYDMGAAGVDARFGDWQGVQGVSSYLQLIAYRAGGPTPTPAGAVAPGASAYPSSNVNGSVDGNPFVLDSSAVITLAADGTGTFSGNDLNGLGLVKGTFNCG